MLAWAACAACGFESFLGPLTGEDHPAPDAGPGPVLEQAVIEGSVPSSSVPGLDLRDLRFIGGDGIALEPAVTIAGEQFTARFPAGERAVGVVVEIQRGTTALRALVPEAAPGETRQAGDFDGIDNRETAACLLIEAKASSQSRALASLPAATLQAALDDLTAASASGAVRTFYDMVGAISACTDCNRGTAVRFRAPVVTASYLAISSGLHPDFIFANPIDYDADAEREDTTEDFDAAMAAALEGFEFRACYCDEAEYYGACCSAPDGVSGAEPAELQRACGAESRPVIRCVFAVDFNAGLKDGSCLTIDRFRWADDKAGASMFFVGGIVENDSPIWDDAINTALGAWTPNTLPMYDDGTHGDDAAGDGIWTISFVLPVGLKMGYKYTWGRQGEQWGGTEEWPGNRRILEIVDVNGDHLVARHDHFGDEATNKDKKNTLPPAMGGTGTVTWDTDANADGIPDARERPRDLDNDCSLDAWWTPRAAQPLTTACE
ncbi:MAG: hypothetical protein JXR96_07240 [Deltaproteobacteria bacterium]|nr:hypothetical protein [Deltaproteobacteria bacterium]